ncbi:hypothetical protein NFI96_017889 [Prochilodus magdalenae]|nr:hypothetical protein NFI96_017889 [Prochilodus magdalenae]
MEVPHSQLSPGERSGGPGNPQHESSHSTPQPTSSSEPQQAAHSQQQHGPSQPKQTKRLRHERKRLRLQKKNVQEMETLEGDRSTWASGTYEDNMGVSGEKPAEVSTSTVPAQACSMGTQENASKQKRERKPQKPGKYVCTYCGRACAKPSVLQKHIRSHTGERPYPCAPCGFSFKTKSNLYKHRKSHTHRVKAGLTTGREAPGEGCHEEPVTESDEDTGQPSSSLTLKNQGMMPSQRACTEVSPEGQSQGMEDSHAVKKRLAMRLSRGRRAPLGSSDEASSSFGLGSKGSTESGYFSRSESTEVAQDSPPNTSAKSYAEVILGKFGRLGNLQRTARQQHEHPAGHDGRSIPFTVPKKQVIDHITKLITINEAVVDTSKIDSVKPRRFSLSRRSSTESKASLSKEALLQSAKEISSKSSGSITLGVPCEKFQHQSHAVGPPVDPSSTAPLLRSHSLPSDATATSTACSRSLRLSQSFEEHQPAHSRRHSMLRRQPAIELPIGAEMSTEEQPGFSSSFHSSVPPLADLKQKQIEPFECEACGVACNNWENYKTHKHHHCLSRPSHPPESPAEDHGTLYKTRPGALAMRKRRKEDSLELDDPALPLVALPPTFAPSQAYAAACEKPTAESTGASPANEKEGTLKGVSVIQHTSLFDKQEPTLRSQGTYEASRDKPPPHDGHSTSHIKGQPSKPTFRKLVRQHNVQVPEILVTEDTDMPVSPRPDVTEVKETEKVGDFQWPQRSPTLAQLPIEKLPPKKKRLRLAEAAQSSGDSSFESPSLPHSPSQDSSLSHTSTHSTSHDEPVKSDADLMLSRRSRAPQTLTIPTGPHHPLREMRRSASEQAPHVPQQTNPIVEARSKSFDYSCLSPDRTPAGWRERRKCLLMRHSAVKEPEEEDIPPKPTLGITSSPPQTSMSPRHSPGTSQSPGPSTSQNVSAGNVVCPLFPQKHVTQWQLNQPPGIPEIPHNVLQVTPVTKSDPPAVMESPQCPSGAARAHYSSVSTGLKLEIPLEDDVEGSATTNARSVHLPHYHRYQHPHLEITPSQELLSPLGMQGVPVRLHSDFPLHTKAVYTTLSQARPQDPSCFDVQLNTVASTFDVHKQQPVPEGSISSTSGGSKRVLSPTSSVEHSVDSQQQKRVKEEEGEDKEQNKANSLIASKTGEHPLGAQSVAAPVSNKETLFPSLQTNLTSSWCYLNYIKPNPSALSESQDSVYSSWCVSTRNPNPLGLSSKEVLSLLYCKQRHSPFTYTMAAMPAATAGKPEVPDPRTPEEPEVHATQPTDPIKVQQAEPTAKEESPKEEGEEDAQSTSKYSEIPRVQICEGGYRSNEEYVYVRGRGRGRYVCEECGIRCKKPSMLRKHIRLHTDARPYVCQHCNFAFKTKGRFTSTTSENTLFPYCNSAPHSVGNLTKHMKSKAHGKRCPEGTAPGPVQCEPETEEGGGTLIITMLIQYTAKSTQTVHPPGSVSDFTERYQRLYRETSPATQRRHRLHRDVTDFTETSATSQRDVRNFTERHQLLYRDVTGYTETSPTLQRDISGFTEKHQQLYRDISYFTERRQLLYRDVTGYTETSPTLQRDISGFTERHQQLYRDVSYFTERRQLLYRETTATLQRDFSSFTETSATLQRDVSYFTERRQLLYTETSATLQRDVSDFTERCQRLYTETSATLQRDIISFTETSATLQRDISGFTERRQRLYKETSVTLQRDISNFTETSATLQSDISGFTERHQQLYRDISYFRETSATLQRRGEEHSVLPEVTEEHQFSDAEDTDEEEDEEGEEGDEEASCSSASSVSRSLSSEDPGPQASPLPLPKAEEPSVLSPARPSKPVRAVSPNPAQYVETTIVGVPSSPLYSFSPGLHLSPALPRSPGRDTSPLRCLSPRLSLSPSPCQSSLSPSSRPVSPLSVRHLSPVRALSPIRPASPSGPLSSIVGASVSVQQRPYRYRDPAKSSPSRFSHKLEKTCSPQRRGYQSQPRFSPPRGLLSRNGQRVLSHLPLHSQSLTPSSGVSLMIPIGGIQMVQSRSGLRQGLSSAQKTQSTLGKQREAKGGPPDKDHRRGPARESQNREHEDKKRDTPSVPLTTWKCISQRKERKRMDRVSACRTSPLTHFHKSTLIKQNTPLDGTAAPKSTWSERASSISSTRENSIRERALVSVPGTNTAKVDRIP